LKYSCFILVCLAAAALFIMPVPAMRGRPAAIMIEPARKQRFPEPNWDLKYNSGSLGLKKEQWLKAALIVGPIPEALNNPAITISINDLREISFNPRAERDSDTMQHMSRSGCGYAKDLMPKQNPAHRPDAFVAWVTSPGAMRRTAEHLNARYPVRFAWSDGGANQELVFSVNSCEYASFLANLRWFADQRWKDIERKFPK
jgi:hypothetical protein